MHHGCHIDACREESRASAFKEHDRRARKKHTCYECGRTIKPGETYRYESGVWDGTPASFKTCKDCLSVREEYFCSYEYGKIWPLMWELIMESNGEIASSQLSCVTKVARDKICELYERYWEGHSRCWT